VVNILEVLIGTVLNYENRCGLWCRVRCTPITRKNIKVYWGVSIVWEYKVKVIKVIDGDTVDVRIDLGFKIHHMIRVRVYGINTPETRTRNLEEKARGMRAKGRMWDLLDTAEDQDKDIILKSHGVGKFGRCLGELFIESDDGSRLDIQQTLIAEGHAEAYFGGKR